MLHRFIVAIPCLALFSVTCEPVRLEDRVERFQARLTQQFTAMDSNLARLNALNSYVTQQLAALTNSSSSG